MAAALSLPSRCLVSAQAPLSGGRSSAESPPPSGTTGGSHHLFKPSMPAVLASGVGSAAATLAARRSRGSGARRQPGKTVLLSRLPPLAEGASRRRQILVASTPEESLDGRKIMAELQSLMTVVPELLKLSYEWTGSQACDPEDDWQSLQALAREVVKARGSPKEEEAFSNFRDALMKTNTWRNYVTALRRSVRDSSTGGHAVVLACIEGGPFTQVEHKEMPQIKESCLQEVRDPKIGVNSPDITIEYLADVQGLEDFVRAVADQDKTLSSGEFYKMRTEQRSPGSKMPARFLCPITGCLMSEPVRAEDGSSYERQHFEAWLRECGDIVISPKSRRPMGRKFESNGDLRHEIQQFLREVVRMEAAGGCKDGAASSIRDISEEVAFLDVVHDLVATEIEKWDVPEVLVLGSESVGKSTLLERICLLSLFPKKASFCTRLPIRLSLRHSANVASQPPPTICVWDTESDEQIGETKILPLIHGCADVSEEMEKIIEEEHSQIDGVSLSREIRLTLVSAAIPTMTIIDLPGLRAYKPETTRELAERYLERHPRALILAVQDAGSPAQASPAMELLRQAKAFERTLGVLSKCDKLDHSELELLRLRLDNTTEEHVPLRPHGYVATANIPSGPASDRGTQHFRDMLLHQAAAEVRWFFANECRDLVQEGLASTDALVDKIRRAYVSHVNRTWLTPVRNLLELERRRRRLELARLGSPNLPKLVTADFHAVQASLRQALGRVVDQEQQDAALEYADRLLQPLQLRVQLEERVQVLAGLVNDIRHMHKGAVITWGNAECGGDSSLVAARLAGGVLSVAATKFAFAAVKESGEVVTWGDADGGGDSSPVAARLAGGVLSVAATACAFAAVKESGEVVTWGDADRGGDSSPVAARLAGGVLSVAATFGAFAAVKESSGVVGAHLRPK